MIRVPEAVMGTVVSFAIDPGGVASLDALWLAVADARAELHRADAVFSTWKPQSPVSCLRRGEVTVGDCPPEVGEVLSLCGVVREQSGGWFDPWAAPGGVDPTGLVKGWAAARALAIIGATGVAGAMVSAGGDVAAIGSTPEGDPWRVGIADPWKRRNALLAVVEVADVGAVCTSGTYERGSHLFSPRSGRFEAAALSATVVGPDLSVADGLATALAVGGDPALDVIDGLAGYEGWFVRPDGTDASTAGWRFAPPAAGGQAA